MRSYPPLPRKPPRHDVAVRFLGLSQLAFEVDPEGAVEPALVGSAPIMQELFRRIAMAAIGDLPVLLRGPTGSGKELAARLLHRYSARVEGPFVVVNCGALRPRSGSCSGPPTNTLA